MIKELSKLTAADAVAKLLPVITLPIVVRALGPETYDRAGLAATTEGLFTRAWALPSGFSRMKVDRDCHVAREVSQPLLSMPASIVAILGWCCT